MGRTEAQKYDEDRRAERDPTLDDDYVLTRRQVAKYQELPDPGGWLDGKWPDWLRQLRNSRVNEPLADMTHTAIPNEHPAWYGADMPPEFVEWVGDTDDAGGLFPDGRLRDPLTNPQYDYPVDRPRKTREHETEHEETRALVIAAGCVTKDDWRCIREAFGYTCAYCGARPDVLQMDHVRAIRVGGQHLPSNILPACAHCNTSKNARDMLDWLDWKGDEFARAAMTRLREGYDRLAELKRKTAS